MAGQSDKPEALIIVCNHFDLTWRRCFDRRFEFKGETVISYADLQEYYITDNLEMVKRVPGYKFQIECAAVARKFLKRHPEKTEELRLLIEQGKLYIPGCGDNIIDSNMVLGESIVQNFTSGILWAEDVLGQKTHMACRMDAFGNSAQLPQILRGCGMKWVWHLSYAFPKGLYWKGLDGSAVLHGGFPSAGIIGHSSKYPPCHPCRGSGRVEGKTCSSCGGRGIEKNEDDIFRKSIKVDETDFGVYKYGFVTAGGEEIITDSSVFGAVEELKSVCNPRFAIQEEALPYISELLECADNPDEKLIHDSPELNPKHTGCYVTRIRTKQNLRRQEYAFLALQALAVMSAVKGYRYPCREIHNIRNKLLFTMFHDAVTGTHIDAAYSEIEDVWRQIDDDTAVLFDNMMKMLTSDEAGVISVVNLTGSKGCGLVRAKLEKGYNDIEISGGNGADAVLVDREEDCDGNCTAVILARDIPPYSSVKLHMKKKHVFPDEQLHADIPEIQNGRFRITADDHGILSIYDKKLKRVISKAGDLRPGEFILEHDEGSPWATLSSDRKRTLLSDSTSIAGIRKGAGYERLSYLIMPEDTSGYVIRGLKIKYDITLYEGMDRIEFKAEVFWDTYNHRLRIAMPVEFSGKQLYEIPYGVLERKPYKPDFGWLCAGGDWPAINWAGVSDSNGLAVLLNKGLPSYSMEDNGEDSTVILLSVLRSPCIPTYLHEPLMHSMTEWDGIRDAGTHSFEYALMAYENPCDYLKAIQDAEIYNSGLYAVRGNMDLPVMPSVISGSIRISCVKAAEKGNAAVVRLVETEGSSRPAIVAIPDYIKEAYRVNLLEREEKKLDIIDGNVRMDMHPFEIATLRLERG